MLSIVPIKQIPNYKFSSKIAVDSKNITLGFELQYNELAGYWIVSISDTSGKYLISGMAVVPAYNILEQYEYLNIGAAYIVPAQTIKEQWPARHTLGNEWYLVWGDTNGSDLNG